MRLPHRFPFRWIDRAGNGTARLSVSANDVWVRGGAALPAAFCVEIVAQAAAQLLGEDAAPSEGETSSGRRWLAGVERLQVERPVRGGDELSVRVRPEGSYGGLVKVAGEIYAGAERICEATLLLR